MKKVSGYIYVRALGQYDFEFYVEDNTTKEDIKKQGRRHWLDNRAGNSYLTKIKIMV